jgi:hypothetical protein
MAALSALGKLLADLLKAHPASSSKALLSGASCASREQNRGEAHVREDSVVPGGGTAGPPASDPRLTRSACNGKQHHRPCRSSHGRKREGQTTDAIDTKVRESQSRGCSRALLYNRARIHLALAKDAPISRPVQTTGSIAVIPFLGSLHHQYARMA